MRNPERILFLLLLLILAASLVSVSDSLLYTPDSARYLVWAQSIARLDGFNDFTLPDPTRYVIHAPLYPVLLVPAAIISPGGVVAAKLTNALFAAFAVWLFFRWTRRAIGPKPAALASGLLALNGLTLIYGTQVLSEIPFAIAMISAVMLAEDIEDLHSGHTAADMAGIVLALTAAMFLREIGVTVVAAFVVLWLLKRQWRAALWVGGLCIVLYVLWFVRNEVVVAGIEEPPLRNSRLLVSHLYTSDDQGLAAELMARFGTNVRTYAAHFSTLIFAPDFVQQSHGLVSLNHLLVQWTLSAMTVLSPIYLAVTIALSGTGIVLGWVRHPSVRRVVAIAALYALPVLLYPINDIRFLYPILVLMLYLGAVGTIEAWKRWMEGRNLPARRWAAFVAVLLAFGPHLVWAGSYFTLNWRLAHDQESLLSEEATPAYYRKTISAASRWIRDHVEPGTTILTRWKEVALEAEGRYVFDVDPRMTPDNFDRTVRDYDVRYVVTVVWQTGVREYETQIEYSSRYNIVPVHRAGTVEVLKVELRQPSAPVMRTIRSDDDSLVVYRAALRLLRRGDPVVAESLLVAVERRMGRYASIVYQQAVAKELAGQLDEAVSMFERLRSVPQAGSILQQAWYHLEIISRLRAAQTALSEDDRAMHYHFAAINYWELGYRGQAFRMLDSALAAQPKFFPALIFGDIFRYQDGDPASAEALLKEAQEIQAVNPLVLTMNDVLSAERELRSISDPTVRVGLLRRQARAFTTINMREDAVDGWRNVLSHAPDDREALRSLTVLMKEKRRYGPAREYA